MIKLLIILFFPLATYSQTRFYEIPDELSDITAPAISASWTESASSVVRAMTPVRHGGAALTLAIAVDATSGTASTLYARHVSPPLAAQTIAGNLKGQFRAQMSSSGATIRTCIVVTVVSPAGAIVATLLPVTSGTLDIVSALTNRTTPVSTALTPYACATGDRIVIETGLIRNSGVVAKTGTIQYASSQGSDLAEDNSGTGGANTWMEFSNTILFNKGIIAF